MRAVDFVWGRSDCILQVCDHVKAVTGVDPAAAWRGTYDSEAAAQAVMAPFGGVLGIMAHGMAAAGFEQGPPAPGRPAVVVIGGEQTAGIVRNDGLVEVSTTRGRMKARLQVLMTWVI